MVGQAASHFLLPSRSTLPTCISLHPLLVFVGRPFPIPDVPPSIGFPLLFPALSVHRPLTKPLPSRFVSAGCRMTIMPGSHKSAYNLGAQSHWRPLRVMANNKSELPQRCTSPVLERSDFPPGHREAIKVIQTRHHVGSVCSVIFTTAVSSQSIICRATDESPAGQNQSLHETAGSIRNPHL